MRCNLRLGEGDVQTRRHILDTAVRLFAEMGYARTPVADIARETGVAVQTIYGSVDQKHQLMTALLDEYRRTRRDTGAGPPIPRVTDRREAIALMVRLTRQLNERWADVLAAIGGAVHVEPELAAAWQNGMGQAPQRLPAARRADRPSAAARSGRRDGRGGNRHDYHIDTWTRLDDAYGWDYDRIERWITATSVRLLLREDYLTPQAQVGLA